MKKRVLSLFMALVMCLSLLPAPVWATELNASGTDTPATAPQAAENDTAVQAGGAVAEVTIGSTTTPYTDIDAAFAAAQEADSATVKLLADVTISHTDDTYGIQLEKGDITLELNGKTISQQSGIARNKFYPASAVFYLSLPEPESPDDYPESLKATTSLTVQDSVGGGKIVQPNGGPAIIATLNTTLTVNSGVIENTSSDDFDDGRFHMTPNCAVLVDGGGKVIINGGTLSGMRGVAVAGYISKEDEDLYREYLGIEGYNNDTYGNELTVAGGEISGTSGNALIVYEKAKKVELSGGTFSSNDTHSIWAADSEPDGVALKGDAASLLAAGYRYENNGAECAYSAEGNGVVGNATVALRPANEYAYIDADGKLTTRANCTEITAETTELTDGWYAVKENITINGDLSVTGPEYVYLILCDGATLTVTGSVRLKNANYSLEIYGQSEHTGTLKAGSAESTVPAIAADASARSHLYIYGGTVTVQAKSGTYSIGETTGKGLSFSTGREMKTVKTDDQNTYMYWYDDSGVSLTITKCKDHVWEYTNSDGRRHESSCKLCSKMGNSTPHSYTGWTDNGDGTHTGTCVCGATTTENHTLSLTANDDGLTHSTKCSVCDYAAAAETHDFSSTDTFGNKKCACGVHLAAKYDGKNYATLASAIKAAKNGGTVTLQAATVTERIIIKDGTEVTIDLNGKEWTTDGNAAHATLVVTGGSVTVQNGTLSTGASSNAYTTVEVEGGKLTVGEKMTIKGGSTGLEASPYTPAIDVYGGELTLSVGAKLDCGMKVSAEGKLLKDYLPAGTAFAVGDSVVNGYVQSYVNSDTLTVAEHTHSSDAEGECDCGFVCEHTGTIGADGKCTVCGAQMAAKDDSGKYYADLSDALDGVTDGGTVTMLATPPESSCAIDFCYDAEGDLIDKTVTLDMNGYSLCWSNENYVRPVITIQSGKLIIANAEISLHYNPDTPAVSVESTDESKGTLEFRGKASIIGGLDFFEYGTLENGLKEGSVLKKGDYSYSVSVEDSNTYTTVRELLPEGYAFAQYNSDGTTGNIVNGYVAKLTEDVIVVKHENHTFGTDGKCDCGAVCTHSGGTASYFKKAVCAVCGNEYGELLTDTTAPTGSIAINERTPFQTFIKTITFGLFFKEDITARITAQDDSYEQAGYDKAKHAVQIEYLVSGTAVAEEALTGAAFTAYSKAIDLTNEESYVVYAKLTDHAGNVTYISTDGFTIDKTAPVINGYTGEQTVDVCGSEYTVTVTDADLMTVTADGVEKQPGEAIQFNYNGFGEAETHTVVAKDKAGNTSTVTFRLHREHDFDSVTGKCKNGCGTDAGAKVQSGSDVTLYETFNEAWSSLSFATGDVTLTLLKDVVPDSVGMGIRMELTMELNGHSFGQEDVPLDLYPGAKFTLTGQGMFKPTFWIHGGASLTVEPDVTSVGAVKIRYEGETPTGWSVALKGGSYGKLDLTYTDNNGDTQTAGTLGEMLVPGYLFKTDVASLSTANDVEVEACAGHVWNNGVCERCKLVCTHNWAGSKCTVCGYECLHSDVEKRDGDVYCTGMCKQQMVVKVESSGDTTYYARSFDSLGSENTLQSLFNDDTITPSGSTVTLLADGLQAWAHVQRGKTITLELNGKSLIETGNGICTYDDDPNNKLIVTGTGSSEENKSVIGGSRAFAVYGGTLEFDVFDFGGTFNGIYVGGGTLISPREQPDSIHIGTLQIGNANAKVSFKSAAFDKIAFVGTSGSVKLGDLLGVWQDAVGKPVRSGNAFQYTTGDKAFVQYDTVIDKDHPIENVETAACYHDSLGVENTCDYCGWARLVAIYIADSGAVGTLNPATEWTEDAINKAVNTAFNTWNSMGGTLRLFAGATLEDRTITNRYATHIDLNGNKITGGTLTLDKDSRGNGVNVTVIDSSAGKDGSFGNITVNGGASLTVDSGAVEHIAANEAGANVLLKPGSRFKGIRLGGSGLVLADCLPLGGYIVDDADSAYMVSIGRADGYYTVAQLDGTITAATKTGSIPYNSVPSDELLPTVTMNDGSTPQLSYKWHYKVNGGSASLPDASPNAGSKLDTLCVITATKDNGDFLWETAVTGYELTVTPGDLSKATVNVTNADDLVYTPGAAQTLAFTVTMGGTTLTAGTDYQIKDNSNTATTSGTHTLTLEGLGNYADTTLTYRWSVKPRELIGISSLVKTYDGTTALPPDDITFAYDGGTVTLESGTDYTAAGSYGSADAGANRYANVTVTLKNANYTFASGTVQEFRLTNAEIRKADVPTPTAGELTVYNNVTADYSCTLSDLLPALTGGHSYGDVTYTSVWRATDSSYAVTYDIDASGKLSLRVAAPAVDTEKTIGSFTITVQSQNYNTFDLTVNVNASSRLIPTGAPTLSASTITYGDAVNTITLSGAMQWGTETVEGTFAWTDGTVKPNAGSYTAEWRFTPSNAIYQEVTGTTTITVAKAGVSVTAPTANALTYNGAAQALVKAGTTADGKLQYSLDGTSWSDAIPTGTQATKYTVWYRVVGDENHTDSGAQSVQVTIARKSISGATITLGDALTYNGKLQTKDVTSVVIDKLNATYTVSGNTGTDAKGYTLTVTGTGNFTGTATAEWSIARKSISGATITLGDALTYNGKAQTQSVTSVVIDKLNATYTVTGNTGTDAKGYTLTVTGTGNFTGTATADWSIAKKSISGATVTLGAALTYNGKVQTQSVTSVVIDGLNATYTITGNTGTDAKGYTLTVTGTGNFTGTATADWSIARKSISGAAITLGAALTYNGKVQTKDVTSVVIDKLNATYTVSGNTGTDAKGYTLTVTGTGNFTGTATADWSIAKKSISGAAITLGDALTYNGKVQTKDVTSVVIDKLNATYTVAGNTGTDAKGYTLTVTGTGNFTGTATADWSIAKKSISGAAITLGDALTYNGKAQTQNVTSVVIDKLNATYTISGNTGTDAKGYALTVTGTGNFTGTATADWSIARKSISGADITLGAALTYNGKVQTKDVTSVVIDKLNATYTVAGNTGTDAKGYTLTVTGTGNFTGTATAEWSIARKSISGADITLGSALTYNGKVQTKDVTSVKIDGLSATYTVSGNTGTDAKGYTLTVTGTGNFTGTATADWSIAKKSISGATVTLGDALTYNGKAQTQSVTSVVIDKLNVTFTVAGNTGTDAKGYTLTVTGTGNFTGTATAEWSIARKSISGADITLGAALIYNGKVQTKDVTSVVIDKLNATYTVSGNTGTDAKGYTLTVTGTGNFTGTATADWSIARKSISGAAITLGAALTYNGKAQTKEVTSVVIDTLSATYIVSGNTGTDAKGYTLTVTGTGNFTGTATAEWSIARKSISGADITLGSALTYNGKVQTKDVTSVKIDGLSATYTVSGNTGTDAKGYTLTVTGTGNFTGTATADWSIAKKSISGATVTLGDTLTYNGKVQTKNVTSVVIGKLDATYTVSGNTGTDAKGYTLTVTGTGNFTGTATAEWSIARKSISGATITLGDALTYNGKAQTQSVTSVVIDKLNATYTVTGNTGTDAKGYTLTVTGTGNFTGTATAEWSIAKAGASVTAPTANALTYNGAAQALVKAGTTADGKLQYSLDGTSWSDAIPTGTQATKYTVWYKVVGDGNHTDSGAQSVQVTIARKSISGATVTLGDALIYNGKAQTQNVTSVKIDGLSATYTVTGNTGTDAKGYTLTVTGTGNFTGTATADWSIAKAGASVTAPTANALTYNGAAQALVKAGTTADGKLQYSLDGTSWSDTIPTGTQATKYTVWYKVVGDENHTDSGAQSVQVTIARKSISGADITLGAALIYNGKAQTKDVTSVVIDKLNATYTVSGNTGTDAKGYALTVTGTGNFTGTATAEWSIARKSISGATITLGVALTYNGKVQTKDVTSVVIDKLSATYTVSGNTGTDAKGYTLTVTGTGNFTGTATAEWSIARKSISGADITLGDALTYNGKVQTKSVTSVEIDGLNATYTVSGNTGTDAKDYTLTVTGTGNFTGTATADWSIAKKSISGAAITLGDALTYNGKAQTQSVTSVVIDKLDATYTVTGNTGTDAKGYTLTVTGTGNFTGTATADWSIAKKSISGATITLGDALTYNGKAQTKNVTSVVIDTLSATYTVSGNTGTDAKGYTLTVTGTGNFTGTATADWSIAKKSISGATVTLGDALTYNGKAQTQSVTSVVIDKLNVTFTVAGNTGTDAKGYTLTVTGTGNFTGTATAEWSIARKSISGADITLGAALIYNGKVQTKDVTSVVIDKLNATYTVAGNTGTDAKGYTLTVTGTGNFTGTATAEWSIARKSISGADITLGAALTYNGKVQTKSVTSVEIDGLNATYTITGNTGTDAKGYTLTVTGTGNFTGTATAEWSIARKSISGAVVDMESAVYTGSVQSPKLRGVTVDAMTLTADKDYTVQLTDGVSAGGYSVILTGCGNFTGTAQRSFIISKAALTVPALRVDITNDYASAYTLDLRAALNAALPAGCSFGSIQYGAAQFTDSMGYCDQANITVSSQGVLTLAIRKVSSTDEGQVAVVTIPVTTANYQTVSLTVELYAANKAIPTGSPSLSRTTLRYGETLSAISLWGGMRCGSTWVSGTFAWVEPGLRPASGSCDAQWVFTPADGKYAVVTGVTTITVAEPPATVPVYTVNGTVRQYRVIGGQPADLIEGAIVTIRKGTEVLGGQKYTDANGAFSLQGVTPGVYNVVVEYQGKTVTSKVEITDQNLSCEVFIPIEDVNSTLDVGDTGSLTGGVVVGGLDEEASRKFSDGTLPSGSTVSLDMELKEQAPNKDDAAQKALRKELTGKALRFIDTSMTLTQNGAQSQMSETDTVLEIILPFDTARSGIAMARHQLDANGNDITEKLEESDTKQDGTFYIDTENKCIHIFTRKLATYAVGYTPYSGGGSGSSTVKSADTGDVGLAPYAITMATACLGMTVLRSRRKRED